MIFFVVSDLIAPAILGLDFLQLHNLVLDFSQDTGQVYPNGTQLSVDQQQLKQMVNTTQNNKPHVGMITAVGTDSSVPGKTTLDCHYIPTKDPPICVPP